MKIIPKDESACHLGFSTRSLLRKGSEYRDSKAGMEDQMYLVNGKETSMMVAGSMQ